MVASCSLLDTVNGTLIFNRIIPYLYMDHSAECILKQADLNKESSC